MGAIGLDLKVLIENSVRGIETKLDKMLELRASFQRPSQKVESRAPLALSNCISASFCVS